MARMLGTCQRSFCPVHRNKGFGLDCPDVSRSKGAARAGEKRRWRRDASVEAAVRAILVRRPAGRG